MVQRKGRTGFVPAFAAAAVLGLAGVVADATLVLGHATAKQDKTWALDIHRQLPHSLEPFMVFVSLVGDTVGIAGIALAIGVLLLLLRRALTGLLVIVATGGAAAIETVVKVVVHRGRPHLWHTSVVEHGYSFPSGHATATTALCVALTYAAWRFAGRGAGMLMALVSIVIVTLMDLSRLFLGVHWPTDVIGGSLLGLFWASLLVVLLEVLFRNVNPRHWAIKPLAGEIGSRSEPV